MPSGLTEAGRRVLMLQVSLTQKVDRKVLPFLMISKLERLISEAETRQVDLEAVLAEVPDLALAVQSATTPRQMAEAMMEAESLAELISRAVLTKTSPKPLDIQTEYQAQTLEFLLEDLAHELENRA
jgi:hypothetical protein